MPLTTETLLAYSMGTSVTFNGERWFVATADREALRTIRLYREAA